jgi:rhodanese-related sulfurtransferase
MNFLRFSIIPAAAAVLSMTGLTAAGGEISAQQLLSLLAQPGPHPVLIDIRDTNAYVSGSIPSAINVPARVLLEKRLNLSRGCVLISDGLVDKVDPAELADKLAATGVSNVNYLYGGLAAWSELEKAPTTTGTGATIGRTNSSVTYQDLEKRDGGVCLVDLRTDE